LELSGSVQLLGEEAKASAYFKSIGKVPKDLKIFLQTATPTNDEVTNINTYFLCFKIISVRTIILVLERDLFS
jgi:hypothetical protein